MEQHHIMINSLHKSILCTNGQGNQVMVQVIPKKVFVRQIYSFQVKKCIRKGYKLFAVNIWDRDWKRTMHRRLSHSCRIQGLVSRENPRITSKMRHKFFHRTDTRISSGFQSPLLHECTKIGGTQTVIAGVDRKRIYPTKCVPLRINDTFCKEEGW